MSSSTKDDTTTQLIAPSSLHDSNTVVVPRALIPEDTCLCFYVRTFNVIMLGISFWFMFLAWNPCQNYQSKVNKELGETSLGILYLSFAITGFFSPMIVKTITEKWAMFFGGLMYVIYMGCNILMSHPDLVDLKDKLKWIFFIGGSLNGIGASLLWTAQGAFLAKNSNKSTLGRNTGIFFGLFHMNQIVGNLSASALLSTGLPLWQLFSIFCAVGFLAILTFLILRHPPQIPSLDDEDEEADVPAKKKTVPISEKILKTFQTLVSSRFLFLVAMIIYSGLSQAFFFGKTTKYIGDILGEKWIGYVMAAFGGFDVFGSFTFGRLIDKFGKKPILFLGSFCILSGVVLVLVIPSATIKENIAIAFIITSLFGLADAAYHTVIYSTIGVLFKDDLENGFGAFRLLQSTTTAIHFFIGPYLSVYVAAGVLSVFMLAGVLFYQLLDWFVTPVDVKRAKSIQY